MKLSATIFLPGNRIDYEYNVATNTHSAWFAMDGKSVRGLTAGAMLNHLVPFRDYPNVQELITWLAR